MFNLDFKGFVKETRKGNWVAVTRTILADLETPVSSFLKIAGYRDNAFLLESAEQAEHIGRFSIIGVNPELILEADSQYALYETAGDKRRKINFKGDLVDLMREKMKSCKLANPEALEGFTGGFVGYLSYENIVHFDDIQLNDLPGPDLPTGVFFLCSDFLIFDHFKKQIKVVALVEVNKKKSLKSQYEEAIKRIAKKIKQLEKRVPLRPAAKESQALRVQSNMTKANFKKKVQKIKEYIRAGDCIQVVLSQKFVMPGVKDDFRIYRALRSINPSPYMFYFRYGNVRLVGASPEVLVKKQGREAEVRPIAGTRPRGATLKEDLKFEESLKKSKKEMAEHLMLVDLGRNDLGRVCQFESVKVKNYARVERYSHVMHLVSDVVGILKNSQNPYDLLKATFPAGTVSGAPKIRAMQIINELETERRGPYAGCLGYFSFTQDLDMCITIRTLSIYKNKIYLQAGAGIVKDSDPAREYEETVNKAKALMKAIQAQGTF